MIRIRRAALATLGVIAAATLPATPALAGSESTLPDGRVYELVTPPNKEGAGVGPTTGEGGLVEAAENGDAFTYLTSGVSGEDAEGNRSFEAQSNIATRSSGGWSSRNIATANGTLGKQVLGAKYAEYAAFSGDLTEALVAPFSEALLSPLQGEDLETTIFHRDTFTDTFIPLVTHANVFAGVPFDPSPGRPGELRFDGATPDLKHVVMSSRQPLTSEVKAASGYENLYEWTGGHLELVSVLPNGHPASEPGEGQEPAIATLGSRGDEIVRDSISSNGAKVVWSTELTSEHLYIRDVEGESTAQLDVVQSGDGTGTAGTVFQGAHADADGTVVYFTDTQRLTGDSHASIHSNAGEPDLYAAEVKGDPMQVTVTDLTKDRNTEESAHVEGNVLGYGADATGEELYYVAGGALAPGATPGDCQVVGFCTLYAQRFDGATKEWAPPRAVARLALADHRDWGDGPSLNTLGSQTARVSPDGRFMVFMSQRPLTGYDNRDAVTGERDQEVFLFDAASGGLRCVSCNPAGIRPHGLLDPTLETTAIRRLVDPGPHTLWTGQTLAGSVPAWDSYEPNHASYSPRYVSNSGRVFFDSPDALVPADANGVEDVYEWDPEGLGGCGPASASPTDVYVNTPLTPTEAAEGPVTGGAGCVGLISSGTSSEESVFLDASESGNDAFILTTAQLTGQDTDKAYDIYDAHVCTAESPCPPGAGDVPPACNDADSCRSAPASQPGIYGPPPSATFNGVGNAAGEPAPPVAKPKAKKPPTRAQKLAAALRACRKDKNKSRRSACERPARKAHGPTAAKKKKG